MIVVRMKSKDIHSIIRCFHKQTIVSRLTIFFGLFLGLCTLSTPAVALEASKAVQVKPLLKTTTSWNGKQIVWPQGKAELTALRVEIAPGAETAWHTHSVPSFAVMLEGTLEVRLEDGRTKRLQAGDVLAEVVDTKHAGRNIGKGPVKLVVFYTGVQGKPHTAKVPEK